MSDPNVLARLDAAARQSVLELHLPSVGVTDFGHIAGSGFGRNVPLAHLEVFLDGLPMRLAEWPNGDWTSIASVPKGERIVDSSGKPRGTRTDRFHYDGDRPKRWKSFDDVWVHGYWFVDWADQYLRVKTVDMATRAVVIEPPQSGYGYKKGQRFRFLNLIEELDRPGEYYVDRKSGMLYVWPPEEATRNVAIVSLLAEPADRISRRIARPNDRPDDRGRAIRWRRRAGWRGRLAGRLHDSQSRRRGGANQRRPKTIVFRVATSATWATAASSSKAVRDARLLPLDMSPTTTTSTITRDGCGPIASACVCQEWGCKQVATISTMLPTAA